MRICLPYQQEKYVQRIVHEDTNNPGELVFQTRERLDELLDFCKDRQEDLKFAKFDGLVPVAEIPLTVYERAVREGWDTPEGWREWANKAENAPFRLWKGRI